MIIRRLLAALALGTAMLAATAQPPAAAASGDLIGVAMPTMSNPRWIDDGDNIVKQLTAKGYRSILQYADDDISIQISQIEDMVAKGAKVLVIASIDGTTLSGVLAKAHGHGIKVIAYDRLIRGSPDVDYYTTFDNYKVGVLQASGIIDKLGLKAGKGPFTIELFGGSPDDNNASFYYGGAMSLLQPYIDRKRLVIGSGQTGMDKVSTLRWDGAVAQARMDNLLSAYYATRRVDAVLAPNDGLAIGVISSLKGVGYGSAAMPMPVITGQDCDIPSVKAIIAGEQTTSVYKDTRELARVTVGMVDALEKGTAPQVNDTRTYNNGVKVVPSYLLDPVLVDKANYKRVLIDGGYYKASQFQ